MAFGANFFAFAPGKVMSYARNEHTLNELSKHGFEIVTNRCYLEESQSEQIKKNA